MAIGNGSGTGTVASLHIHPIKSCRRVEVESVTASTTGLVGDREWQVISEIKPVTQRSNRRLAVVEVTPIEGGLRLAAPGHSAIEVERPGAADTTSGSLIGVKVDAADAGDQAARWFGEVLDEEVRLVALPTGGSVRVPDGLNIFGHTTTSQDALAQEIAFNDLSPVLVANSASYDWLAARASEPFPIDRFRSNIVVETDEPFSEDTWATFRIGQAAFRHGVIWPRCAVPQVDQETGERRKEPAVVLKAHRWCASAPNLPETLRPVVENSGIFGIGCSVGPVGTQIAVGDTLTVDETMAPIMTSPIMTNPNG
ncbi:MAG: MOSC domain-containing protein [Acidimicrobiales bacterium]